MNQPAYAHSRPGRQPVKWQKLEDHLEAVAEKSKQAAAKAGLSEMGELIGLLHDLGKYSQAFQEYMKAANGVDVLDDEGINGYATRGKVDHSSAGGQFIWRGMKDQDPVRRLVAQMMAICIVSHHSGLIDSISPNGDGPFTLRMDKSSERTHVDEIEQKMAPKIRKRIFELDRDSSIQNSLCKAVSSLLKQRRSVETGEFAIGLLVRFLFSALIDADRLDAADFERRAQSVECFAGSYPDWAVLAKKLEEHLTRLPTIGKINGIRASTSARCQDFAVRDKGLFKLTVPTGGGKTLASLRFALHHAAHHRMDRIIYVIPYTSIIDQNAAVVRSILEVKGASFGAGKPVVLAYHSSLTPEQDTRQSKILAENWDAPVVFTTAVQFLETLFASGTRGARRMHQLANAVIIFDEIQTIPIKTVHLFNNAINFLVGHCGSTAVFCTATQPLLDKVDDNKGSVVFSPDHEIVPDVKGQFRALRRVEVIDGRKSEGWTTEDVADRACEEMQQVGSVLVIVNTKAAARDIYVLCKKKQNSVFHLSTNMCPAHRRVVLRSVKQCLNPGKSKPVICVSTQLIEGGWPLGLRI